MKFELSWLALSSEFQFAYCGSEILDAFYFIWHYNLNEIGGSGFLCQYGNRMMH
jgi:hypothetical protein